MRSRLVCILLVLGMSLIFPCRMLAIQDNPTLAFWILKMKSDQEKAIKAEKLAQALMTEGHVFIGREVQATNEFQREFNNYLDTFHDAIVTAAQLYGIYYEIKKTVKLVGDVSEVLSSAPTNAIAVGLTPNRSGIYGTLINSSLEVAQDIYNACIAKQKLTEQDRNEILSKIRTKIRRVNSQLTQLVVFLRYTSLEDVWYRVTERMQFMTRRDKHAAIERCFERWHHNVIRNY